MKEFDKSISIDGRDIRLKVGLFAPQAGGSVLVQSGDTAVLVTATQSTAREGIDFLPLLVDYEERLYAAGRIPGGFLRREGRPPERATLTSRLIDRPMRPLFPGWMRDDIQIVATTVSMDETVPPDVLAATGASVAVQLAKIPFNGPMAAVRVGLVGDDFIINPTYKEIEDGDLDLVVAGSPDGVIMVEAGANQLPEQDMIEAIDFGYEVVQDLIKAQKEMMAELGIEPVTLATPETDPTLADFISSRAIDKIKEVLKEFELSKPERDDKLDAIKAEIKAEIDELPEDHAVRVTISENGKAFGNAYKALTKKLMRSQIVNDNIRVDGRKLDQVRPITSRTHVLPDR
ncbi:MAG: polyribonucleotide nucleotidyltransferase, partial [Cyanobacteria bacterium J06627_15]